MILLFTCLGLVFSHPLKAQNDELQSAIDRIKAVTAGGRGHDEAVQAIAVLNEADADDVPQMLKGMEGANKLALNWLRGGIQSALDKGPLPARQIKAYLDDASGSHMGRLMAFELLAEADDTFAETNVANFVEDPSLPLRQMAVADYIEKAKSAEAESDAIGMLAFSLPHARDVDQVQTIVKMMGDRGIRVDLQKQLGFIPNWHIVGPFDNTGEAGFDKVLGPEADPADVDLQATYDDSKTGEAIGWEQYNSIEPSAVVDLNEFLVAEKGVIAYAYTEFNSGEEQDVDIRIGCINGNKVWVNGEEVINNEIYHVGMMPDQFVGKATLKKGVNKILFKVCQNEQTQPWANRWMYQMRICLADGKAVLPYQPAPPRR